VCERYGDRAPDATRGASDHSGSPIETHALSHDPQPPLWRVARSS
jgi:hypothetical protein